MDEIAQDHFTLRCLKLLQISTVLLSNVLICICWLEDHFPFAFIVDNLVVNYYPSSNLYFQVKNFDEYYFIFFLTSKDENP